MRRNEIQQEIAELDKQITEIVSSVKLPELRYRPFPLWTWVFAIACLSWGKFGGAVPQLHDAYLATGLWSWYAGLVMALIALISTITWFFRGRGYGSKSDAYADASRRARSLQERRRELQSELRSISED